MPNTNAPVSTRYRGWFHDILNNTLEAYHGATRLLTASATAVTFDLATTFSGGVTHSGTSTNTGTVTNNGRTTLGTTGILSLGTPATATIASGVLTATKSFMIMDAEGAGTTDTLDSITFTGQATGDLLLLVPNATDTITADNSATLLLGAATRVIAPGGSLLLVATSATVWTEVSFLTATS